MDYKVPKFLIAEDPQCTTWYVVHTQRPKFVAEFHRYRIDFTSIDVFDREDGAVEFFGDDVCWLDDPFGGEQPPDASEMAKLARQAGDAIAEFDRNSEKGD